MNYVLKSYHYFHPLTGKMDAVYAVFVICLSTMIPYTKQGVLPKSENSHRGFVNHKDHHALKLDDTLKEKTKHENLFMRIGEEYSREDRSKNVENLLRTNKNSAETRYSGKVRYENRPLSYPRYSDESRYERPYDSEETRYQNPYDSTESRYQKPYYSDESRYQKPYDSDEWRYQKPYDSEEERYDMPRDSEEARYPKSEDFDEVPYQKASYDEARNVKQRYFDGTRNERARNYYDNYMSKYPHYEKSRSGNKDSSEKVRSDDGRQHKKSLYDIDLPTNYNDKGIIFITKPKNDPDRHINKLMNKIIKYKMDAEMPGHLRQEKFEDVFSINEMDEMKKILAAFDKKKLRENSDPANTTAEPSHYSVDPPRKQKYNNFEVDFEDLVV